MPRPDSILPENIVIATADVPLHEIERRRRFPEQHWPDRPAFSASPTLAARCRSCRRASARSPHHVHHCADEMMLILEGEGTYRWGDARLPVKAGDLVGAPKAAQAHQLVNSGATPLKYLTFSSNPSADVVEYPDSGKVAYRAGMVAGDRSTGTARAIGRLTVTDYWDGEVGA